MFELITTTILISCGFFIGRAVEAKHYRSIKKREANFRTKPAVTGEFYDEEFEVLRCDAVVGSVVVSVDYFKRFLAGFRLFFGGELRTYSPLLDRGRREAILRMKESAPHADIFVNCRLVTSSISSGRGNSLGTVEVLAYGTAITYGPRLSGVPIEVRTEAT